ncbi:MAG: glycosyltransferase [Bacteroidales bacterium]|nr:glycosyltransferase [Bacteroidales bacterium]
MADPITIFYILLIFFGVVYYFIIFGYTIGWYSLKTYEPVQSNFQTKASIIIAARNEEQNIENLLNDLILQDYPTELYEIFIVNDNSTDKTATIVESFISQHPENQIKLINITKEKPNQAYKKKAINLAIDDSGGDLIITTDADCRMGKKWLGSFVSLYEPERPRMIVGPVCFHNETSIFEKIQTLEFLSLIAITGGAIRIGRPIMCNGANLVYEKKTFLEVGGFGSDAFSSGDDVFLLLKIRKKFGYKSVRFLKNNSAIVFTEAKKSVRDFFHQRTRWASKNKGYDIKILIVSFSVYMTNLLLVCGLMLSIIYAPVFKFIILGFILKSLIELPILIGIGNFVKRSRMFLYSFPLIFLYPVYIIITGALGIISSYNWKGRTIKK